MRDGRPATITSAIETVVIISSLGKALRPRVKGKKGHHSVFMFMETQALESVTGN